MERNEKENGLTVNIENYTGEKPIEIVYREGAAPKSPNPLETKEPEKIGVSGVISTPFDWLEKRIGTIDQKRANVKVDREKMTITLTVNEDDYYTKTLSLERLSFQKPLKSSVSMMPVPAGFRQSWVSFCELTVCCLPTKKSA